MKKPDTFSVALLPLFDKERKGKTPLYLRITVNGKRSKLSLQRNFTTSLWDPKFSRLKGTSAEARQINAYLDEVLIQINQAYRELLRENKIITPKAIKARFLGEDSLEKTLLQLIQYHNFTMKEVLKPGTLKNYFGTEKYLKRFLQIEKKAEDIYLSDLNYAFIIDFEIFLRRNVAPLQSKLLSNNGVMKHLERLKKLLNLAVKLEWVPKDPFVRFTLRFERTERPFLSQNEVDQIQAHHFERETVNKIRDIFIFSCYTGLSYIDVKHLKKGNIVRGIDGSNWIYSIRRKTDQMMRIPLLAVAEGIILKYKSEMQNQTALLPVYSNQKTNIYLKEIATQVKINKNLTFHCARHTFATTITLSNGVPIETVSKLLGHSKLSTTQIYAKVLEKRISDDIGNLKAILEKKEQKRNYGG